MRALQAQLGTADNGEITDMIDRDLEEQFKVEKHLNVQLKTKIKECEMEKMTIIEQLKQMEAKHDVTVVSKTEQHIDLEKAEMNVTELINYRKKVADNLVQVEHDMQAMIREEDQVYSEIHALEQKIASIRVERNHHANNIQYAKNQMDSRTSTISHDQFGLKSELGRHKSMLACLVLDNSIHKGVDRIKRHYFEEFMFKMKESDQ